MAENKEVLERLQALLCHKKGKSYYANKLGISELEVVSLLRELKSSSSFEETSTGYWLEGDIETYTDVQKGTIKSSVVTNFDPKSPEELATLHKVDLSKYKISSYWTKQRGDKFTSSLLCTIIKPSDFNYDRFIEFVEQYKSTFSPEVLPQDSASDSVDVVMSIADFHLDKLTLEKDDINRRADRYKEMAHKLVDRVDRVYNIDKMVFVIGNDFFHTDNYMNSTTNLTPQDIAVSYNEAYEVGFDLLVKTITTLRQYCKTMEIILVQGNHDRTKSYYLAHALEVYFKNDKFITFDREHSPTKFTMLGSTFIGFHHGNTKIDDLPLLFATSQESSIDFGMATYREVHTGDKHYYMAKEIKGVRVQQMPSLSGVDRWHLDNNYINNVRAAIALVYHPEKGKIMEVEERI